MIDCTVDSSTMVDVLRGRKEATPILSRYSEVGLSHVALGELLLGAFKSNNPTELDRTLQSIIGLNLIHGDDTTAVNYACIRRDLERKGTPIPHNDIWIAATSIQLGVPLISRDKHFRNIAGLVLLEY